MVWAYTDNVTWNTGLEGREAFDEQPVDANTLILEGAPVGANGASVPVGCARTCVAGDDFLGIAVASADNRTASATKPDVLNYPSYGDGTTGANGAKVRLLSGGRFELEKGRTPDTAGVIGNGITGLAGDQSDVKKLVYFNSSGFTNTAGGNTLVGAVVAVKLSNSGGVIWVIEIRSAAIRLS